MGERDEDADKGGDTWEKGSVTKTPTRGRYVGMGERDEDADKGGDTWEKGSVTKTPTRGRYVGMARGGIFKCGSGTRRYAQVQTGAPYPVMHLP